MGESGRVLPPDVSALRGGDKVIATFSGHEPVVGTLRQYGRDGRGLVLGRHVVRTAHGDAPSYLLAVEVDPDV